MAERNGHDLGLVRPLDPSDLPDCLDLAAGRGWPREDVKWRFALDAGSVFGVDDAGVSEWLAGRGVRGVREMVTGLPVRIARKNGTTK